MIHQIMIGINTPLILSIGIMDIGEYSTRINNTSTLPKVVKVNIYTLEYGIRMYITLLQVRRMYNTQHYIK